MLPSNIEINGGQRESQNIIREVVRLIAEGHTITLRLRGKSMRPFLEDGRDKVLLSGIINPKIGDVVLAEVNPNFYVLHRIIKIQGGSVTLRGDGNLSSEHCQKKDIKAFAVGFYRKGREKIEKTNEFKWVAYSIIWCLLYPVRRYLLAIYRRFVLKNKTLK